MDTKQRKQAALIGGLLVILAVSWGISLRPSKTTAPVPMKIPMAGASPAVSAAGAPGVAPSGTTDIDVRTIEEKLVAMKTRIADLEGGPVPPETIALQRDPMAAWKPGASFRTGLNTSGNDEIIPDFILSGIVYDAEKPLAIINNEVKALHEKIGPFVITQIRERSVLLTYKKKTFSLTLDSSGTSLVADGSRRLSGKEEPDRYAAAETGEYRNILRTDDHPAAPNRMEETAPAVVTTALTPPEATETAAGGNGRTIVTIQAYTFGAQEGDRAKQRAAALAQEGYQDVRVEAIGENLVVRVGIFKNRNDSSAVLRRLRTRAATAFVRTALYREDRIVYAPAATPGGAPAATPGIAADDKSVPAENSWERERTGRNRTIRTIQVISCGRKGREDAVALARRIEENGYADVRVERVGGLYTVRVGRFDETDNPARLCRELKNISASSFVRKAYYEDERIVYPQ